MGVGKGIQEGLKNLWPDGRAGSSPAPSTRKTRYFATFIGSTNMYNRMKTNSWKKSGIKPSDIPKEKFIEITNESASMSEACAKMGLHMGTYTKYAKLYGCHDPKKGRKKIIDSSPFQPGFVPGKKIPIGEIIYENKHPYHHTGAVKRKILNENIKPHQCEKCNLTEWNGVKIPLELNHIDGDRHNHHISNLELLCPNCHAQTDTYRGKNKKRY